MSGASPRAADDPASATHWAAFKEWLLPSVTFSGSATPKRDLKFGRILLTLFYALLTSVFIYTVVRLCWSGRIELFSNLYKVDTIEAPSLAFCPFNPNDSIEWPKDPAARKHSITAHKADLQGSHNLKVSARNCSFDRNCACVDMGAYHLSDSAPEVGSSTYIQHPAGGADTHAMVFRENIDISTNFSDPSPERILKVGIYDSFDTAPDWFYVNEGSMFIGQLELTIWTVVDISIHGLVNTFKGDWRAMVKNRHIFRYTSQQVGGNNLHHNQTSIRYEMKTFFVEETMSSHRAFSLYTVGVIVALLALRFVVVDAFFLVFIPEYQEHRDKPTVRELSPTSIWLRNLLCCFPSPDAEPGETDPLLEGKGMQA